MQVTQLHDVLFEIAVPLTVGGDPSPVARIERGPLLKTATASAALFASGALHGNYNIGKIDRNGAVIVDGQEFAYLDWYAEHVWHVYEFVTEEWTGPNTPVLHPETGEPLRTPQGGVVLELGPAWRRRGYKPTQAEAMADATAIALTRSAA